MKRNPQSMIHTLVESDSSEELTDRKPGSKSAGACQKGKPASVFTIVVVVSGCAGVDTILAQQA